MGYKRDQKFEKNRSIILKCILAIREIALALTNSFFNLLSPFLKNVKFSIPCDGI